MIPVLTNQGKLFCVHQLGTRLGVEKFGTYHHQFSRIFVEGEEHPPPLVLLPKRLEPIAP